MAGFHGRFPAVTGCGFDMRTRSGRECTLWSRRLASNGCCQCQPRQSERRLWLELSGSVPSREQHAAMRSLVQRATEFYLSSRDFNGISLADLYREIGLTEAQFKEQLLTSIRQRELDLIYGGDNPHIKPFPASKVREQVTKLESIEIDEALRAAESEAMTFGP